MKLHALTLRALALGCSALVPIQAAAQSQSFTVGDAQTQTYTVSDGGTGTVTSTGSIAISTDNTNAIIAKDGSSAARNTVQIDGTVATTRFDSTAVLLGQYGDLTLSAGASIATTGDLSDGILLEDESVLTTERNSTIMTGDASDSTAGETAIGISAEGVHAKVFANGSIFTYGTKAHGIRMGSSSKLTNTGTIETQGDYALGIEIANGWNVMANQGAIHTSGYGAHGIYITGGNNVVSQIGSIITSGEASAGVFSSAGKLDSFETITLASATTTTAADNISTVGEGAYGVRLGDFGRLTVGRGAKISTGSSTDSTTGMNADGIHSLAKTIINNAGDIITYGLGSIGIKLASFGGSLDHSGSIVTKGDGAHGVQAISESELDISGSIATDGVDATGVFLADYGNSLNLTGDVTTEGMGAHGISASGTSSLFVRNAVTIGRSGSVTTQGAGAYGVYLGNYNTLTIEPGGHIETNGENAYGVYALDNTSIANASTTLVTNSNGAHGTKAVVASFGGELSF